MTTRKFRIRKVSSIRKSDFSNVGIVGQSQGGVGVINAVTNTAHKDIYKTAVSLSPANKELADNLM